ncbi:MAG: tRNA threonylcarbamoyladenosine biosynthesis protein TsaB [Patescibacteria group bacterium]|nr:hypothetical protein [Candidatus Saccharibacteria bacterium]MDQ5963233.1 tRNA threonylcarbamoyladenosine biosynthesis protein TsaB [Patescibacteria group bacterium]
MIILTIRTDKPEAEIGLYDGLTQVQYTRWQAHRQLAETIHVTVDDSMKKQGITIHDIEGVLCFEGPGSFTGLRIGLTVGNALAEGLGIPVVASSGDSWQDDGIQRLLRGENDRVVVPHYGAPVHITAQKK